LLLLRRRRGSTILKLRFFAGLTQSEIAQQVGLSQMHVSRLLSRTLARLREELPSEP
jgi:RNA polymerase sigma-B factor